MKNVFLLAAMLLTSTYASTQVSSSTLILEITTGGDDLRTGSIVYCTVTLTDGTVLPEKRFDGPLANNTTVKKTFNLGRNLSAKQVKSITLRFNGGGGFSGDNWNLQTLNISLSSNGALTSVYRSANDPARRTLVARFTGQNKQITLNRQ